MADQRNVTAVVDASPELLAVAILARAARHAMDMSIADEEQPMVFAGLCLGLAISDVEAWHTEAERVARDALFVIAMRWFGKRVGLVKLFVEESVRLGGGLPS